MNSEDRPPRVAELRRLLARGPAGAKTLANALDISQPTFSRLIQEAGADIVAFGAARARQYGIVHTIRDIGPLLPIFQITAQGQAVFFGDLTMLLNDWYVFQAAAGNAAMVTQGMPYFLQDLRPQGFLGARVAHEHPDLNLPEKVVDWRDDDVLYYAARRGEHVMGDLILGNESMNRFFHTAAPDGGNAVMQRHRMRDYPLLAARANAGHIGTSSAGGEQPKFTVAVERGRPSETEHVLVKFSPEMNVPSGRRWADLLVCEHLALDTLRRNNVTACTTEILISADRVFLEVLRFDRAGARGRMPMVSLLGLDGELGMADKPWSETAHVLARQNRLAAADLETIRLLDVFGALIGNSDRHPGNLSFAWALPHQLALLPCYDMLPMMYRPNSQGEVLEAEFNPAVLNRIDLRHMKEALRLALAFWEAVLRDQRISDDFKTIAQRHRQVIQTGSN